MFRKIVQVYAVLVIIFIPGCEVTTSSADNAEVVERGKKILIKDHTGKEWDVTHAVENYNFVASQFQYGLGPFAIRPILEPEMLNPGDAGYPAKNNDQLVIGTILNRETRAYPLSVLSRHEVADEVFGDQHVAVAY